MELNLENRSCINPKCTRKFRVLATSRQVYCSSSCALAAGIIPGTKTEETPDSRSNESEEETSEPVAEHEL